MRTNSLAVALGLCAVLMLTASAPAQRKAKKAPARKTVSRSGAETGLVGIKLYDSGARVVAVYGAPDEVQAVTFGGGGAGPGGGAAGGAGGRSLPVGGGKAGPGRGPGVAPGGLGGAGATFTAPGVPDDFDFGDSLMNRQGASAGSAGLGPGAMPGGGGGGPVGAGAGPSKGPGGGGGMAGGTTDRVLYTRWVYNRNASKYGFILDKTNRVVQVEAIGIQAGKVRTARGVTFGNTFATLIKKYGAPDGYEFNGDSFVVRYLSKAKCAFRMTKLGENKPDVVTGIVVAAGKR